MKKRCRKALERVKCAKYFKCEKPCLKSGSVSTLKADPSDKYLDAFLSFLKTKIKVALFQKGYFKLETFCTLLESCFHLVLLVKDPFVSALGVLPSLHSSSS